MPSLCDLCTANRHKNNKPEEAIQIVITAHLELYYIYFGESLFAEGSVVFSLSIPSYVTCDVSRQELLWNLYFVLRHVSVLERDRDVWGGSFYKDCLNVCRK